MSNWAKDISIDDDNIRARLICILKDLLPSATEFNFLTTAAGNAKQDVIVKTPQKDLRIEIKTRTATWPDVWIEYTQYKSETIEYKCLDKRVTDKMVWLKNNSTGWMWKTEADLIVYLTPDDVRVILWKKMKDWLINNFDSVESRETNERVFVKNGRRIEMLSRNKVVDKSHMYIKVKNNRRDLLDDYYKLYKKQNHYSGKEVLV
jgi:hypothetical protein